MAISFKEKLAYINKYAKGNDKLVKAVQLGKALEKVKDDTQREKIKKAVNDAFTQIKKINTASSTKTSTAKTALTKQQKIDKEIEKFKKSIGRSKWITATRYMTNSGLRKTTIEKDAQIPALPKGKRISRKTGKAYWENRANRSDVKQPPVDYPKLAHGGYIDIDKFYYIGLPEVTSVDKNGRKTANWKLIEVDKNGNKIESIENIKFSGDAKDVRLNTENAEYVTQQQFDRMYDKMKGKMANGGEMEKIDQRMYNFLEEDLATLEQSINEDDQDTIEKFFSYWIGTNGHIKSLKTKSNARMYNFLEDDLATLEQSIIKNDNEKIEQFFSYWGQHLNSIRYAKGGEVDNWKEFYEMSKDTSGYNPEYEKKFGSYKYQAPHIQEILSNSKSFEDFMNRKNRFEQSKNSDASQNYWGKMDRRSKKAWLLMSGFNESDSNDLLSKQWDDLSNGQKAKLTRGLIKQGDNKSSVFFSEYKIESDKFADGGQIGSGKNGYVAFYKGKRIEVYADTKYQAQQLAAKHFKAKKEWEVNVVLAEVDGKPYVQSTAFAKGGIVEHGLEIGDTIVYWARPSNVIQVQSQDGVLYWVNLNSGQRLLGSNYTMDNYEKHKDFFKK